MILFFIGLVVGTCLGVIFMGLIARKTIEDAQGSILIAIARRRFPAEFPEVARRVEELAHADDLDSLWARTK